MTGSSASTHFTITIRRRRLFLRYIVMLTGAPKRDNFGPRFHAPMTTGRYKALPGRKLCPAPRTDRSTVFSPRVEET
jgi:hypothetical protein